MKICGNESRIAGAETPCAGKCSCGKSRPGLHRLDPAVPPPGVARHGPSPAERRAGKPSPATSNAHYLANLAVEQIADAVGLNPRDMMRLFQSHSAMSVWEYVLRLRVCHAQRLLITPNKKITDIALESGFGSVAPFYAAFEKLAGQAGLERIQQGRSTR